MKKFALTLVALCLTCAFTFAGSPERFKSQETQIAPPPCAQFDGFDVSINVGGAFESTTWNDNDDWIDNFGTDFNTSNPSRDRSGVTTGGAFGYSWQKNCALFGLVVDGSWASIDGTTHATASATPDGTALSIHDNLDFWGTARTRTGIVVDNLLLYITGGFAFANIDHKWTVTDPGDDHPRESFSADSFRWGGVAGAGTEWAINHRWSLRTEFLYCYFTEEHTSDFSPAAEQTVHFKTQDSMFVSRLCLVYRFGPGK